MVLCNIFYIVIVYEKINIDAAKLYFTFIYIIFCKIFHKMIDIYSLPSYYKNI